MATYVPNATQTTEPIESRAVESAALEFRTLKTSINTRILALETADIVLQSNIDAEESERIAADDLIVDMVSPYITQISNLGFTGNMDLGLVSDAVIQARFDLGTL